MSEKTPVRRMPLRQLLTDAEKRARDLIDQVHVALLARTADLRELSRPVRKRSRYPTLLALHNAIQKLDQVSKETDSLLAYLSQQMSEIRDHARREEIARG